MAGSTYLWSTGETTNCITVDEAGTYSVTVTDADGCFSVCSEEVAVNPLPVCTVTGDNTLCEGEASELCTPLVAGSTYLWSTGETTNCITVDEAGTYSVTVTDADGCFSVCSEEVTVNPLPVCTVTGDDLICRARWRALHASRGRQLCITVDEAGTYSVTVRRRLFQLLQRRSRCQPAAGLHRHWRQHPLRGRGQRALHASRGRQHIPVEHRRNH
ncbi:MAG: hypothetical protein H6557_14640 [Lewinellaceae bacterium]|nr:hypothetical protein [Lewinellaceae bacterium]